MADDVLVTRIAYCLPELSRPRPIHFDKDRNAANSPSHKNIFNVSDKCASDDSPSMLGMNDQSIQVAAPAVKGSENRTYGLPVGLGDKQCRRGVLNRPA